MTNWKRQEIFWKAVAIVYAGFGIALIVLAIFAAVTGRFK
jgi:hypothetical protein